MDSVKVDVIIPTFHPKERFLALVEQLEKQVLAVNRIVIVNTEKKAFEALMDCDTFLKEHPKAMLFHMSSIMEKRGTSLFPIRMRRCLSA